MIIFVLIFAVLFTVIFGVPTGHTGSAFASALVVGALLYGILRLLSIPFRS